MTRWIDYIDIIKDTMDSFDDEDMMKLCGFNKTDHRISKMGEAQFERFLTRKMCRDETKALIAAGKLTRPDTCPECGSTDRIDAHHDDYNKPEQVRWMCLKCHAQLHAKPGKM